MNNSTFKSLGICGSLRRALEDIGYDQPTPIQAQAIPAVLAGSDLLGIAQTGTGKTAAFSLPIIDALLAQGARARSKCPRVLILSPTRELAGQIRDEVARYTKGLPVRHACVFGGVSQRPQEKILAAGVEVLVATPGRLLDLANSRLVDLGEVTHLVLDEADRLLDMGFIRDVRKIISKLPKDRQSLLFSATMPTGVAKLAQDILRQPVRVDVSPEEVTVEKIQQGVLLVETAQKQEVLERLLADPDVTRAIVFTRTKHGANRVAKKLEKAGIKAEAVHGNKSQNARQRALDSFKAGKAWVLVATDVAARGIDIRGVSHVINFELPHEPEGYVHRIGRTARAGSSGVAWSLVDPAETKRLRDVQRLTGVVLQQLAFTGPDAELEPVDMPVAQRPKQRANGSQNTGNKNNGRKRRRRRHGTKRAA